VLLLDILDRLDDVLDNIDAVLSILAVLLAFAVTLTPAIDIIRRRLPRSPVDEILRRRRQ
jgi:hypothetical protein